MFQGVRIDSFLMLIPILPWDWEGYTLNLTIFEKLGKPIDNRAEKWSSWEVIVFPSDHFLKNTLSKNKTQVIVQFGGKTRAGFRGVPGVYFFGARLLSAG